MLEIQIVCLALLAYLLGSIPSAVWVGQAFYGLDVRDYGSGNAGATNTFRVLGKKAGVGVLLLDIVKGFTAACLINYLPEISPLFHKTRYINLQLLFGLSAVIGHLFPVFANFRGGKGIATLFGMILAIQPLVAVSLIVVFVFMLFLTRYVSLSSISASIAFPIMIFFVFKEPEVMYRVFALATAIMVVLTHHKNINRLLAGNENKVPLFKKKSKADPS